MSHIDLTHKIERLEALEERLGVALAGLSAFLEDENGYICLTVCGELLAMNGTILKQDIDLVVSPYDTSARVVATESTPFSTDEFFALDTFKLYMHLPTSELSKIRVFPKKS